MTEIQFKPDWAPVAPRTSPVSLKIVRSMDEECIPVVIAEDDPVSRRLVTAVIEAGGFRTVVTSDGNEAMTAFRAQEGACIAVIDWMMPGIDGAEICRRLRESGRHVYIIMVSARGTKTDTIEGMDYGADDYVVKPFDPNELLARVRGGLRIMKTQEALVQRVRALESTVAEVGLLKFQMPL
ncbi:MAG TPA: response regulator [Chthoniobacterales bacterium]|jgi:DNA-binding response OmpR family regulator|nr:response regulator [Chthoniobacterales bacterium]